MVNKPKAIGTGAETAVVRYLRTKGWPNAERRALHGSQDRGDITGTPGIAWEVKAGDAAKIAGDQRVDEWLWETELERRQAGADYGVLVMARRGYGPNRAHMWWAVFSSLDIIVQMPRDIVRDEIVPVRMLLKDAVRFLRRAGYGDPL